MANAAEIRADLVRVLVHEQPLNWFTDRLARGTWNIHRENSEVQTLIGEIYAALAEFSNHHINASELRQQLLSLLSTQRIPIGSTSQDRYTTSTTAAKVIRLG
jgi:hypothetical protein